MGFGKQLKEVLFEIGMSVATLSRETNIPATTIYSIINKDIDNVGLDKVKKIEKAINAIPGNITYNLLYGIEPDKAEVSTRQYDFYSLEDNTRRFLLTEKYNLLNVKGQVKTLEFIEDMSKIPDYCKDQD